MTYDKGMEEKILAALLDLRIALGELQAALVNIDRAARKLMEVQIDALELKNMPMPLSGSGDRKEGSHE